MPRPRQREFNRLLAQLPARDREAVTCLGERVTLDFRAVLARPDSVIRHVYFPLTCFISVVVPADKGESLEVGLIGNEGMLGGTISLGVNSAPLHALVQGAGTALRITAAHFRRELERRPKLERAVTRYCYVLLRQVSQTAACTRFHTIEERLARWLLMTQDRASGAEYHLTQAFLARMLGVRRVGVTQAASTLQARGLIGYRRGEVVISDRSGLRAASCICYSKDKRLYKRTMGRSF